ICVGSPGTAQALAALEIELRRTGHEKPMTEEYALRFPEHDELIRAIFASASGVAEAPGLGLDPDRTGTAEQTRAVTSDYPMGTAEEATRPQAETATGAGFPWLSRYELLAEAGRGAMGVVYRARHRILG